MIYYHIQKRVYLITVYFYRRDDNHVNTLGMKFYCPTLHYHRAIKNFKSPNPLKIPSQFLYSGTPLVRPLLLRQKIGLSRGGSLSSGVEINTFMSRFTMSNGLSRGDDLLSGWSVKRGSTVHKSSAHIVAPSNAETINDCEN